MMLCESETNFDAGLDRSRTARLEYGRQAVCRIAGAHHQVLHRYGLSKQRVAQIAHRIGETGMIQEIERADARVQRASAEKPELTPQACVYLEQSRSCQNISTEVSVQPGGRFEGLRIQLLASG